MSDPNLDQNTQNMPYMNHWGEKFQAGDELVFEKYAEKNPDFDHKFDSKLREHIIVP